MDGRVVWRDDPGSVAAEFRQWQDAGATHVSVNTMGGGLKSADDHLAALAAAIETAKAVTG
jgi:hypothetical protein